jgi:hypothetical protein
LQVVAALALSPEFGELLLELLILYGEHEDSDKQSAFLNRVIADEGAILAARRDLMACMAAVSDADRALTSVVKAINTATDDYSAKCDSFSVPVSRGCTRHVKAGVRAASLDKALGGDSHLDADYTKAREAVIDARRKVSGLTQIIALLPYCNILFGGTCNASHSSTFSAASEGPDMLSVLRDTETHGLLSRC